MKFIIDTLQARKNKISLEKYLICIAIAICDKRMNFKNHYEELFEGNMIFEDDLGIHLTEKAMQKVSSSLNIEGIQDERTAKLNDIACAMKDVYPKGIKPGTVSSWRGTTKTITDHLERFFSKFGEYSKDQIVQATKEYVDSFNGNFDMMKTLPYFIVKNEAYFDDNGMQHYKEKSLLAERIEMLGEQSPKNFDTGDLIV